MTEKQVAVDLVRYVDSLMGRKTDYETMDCVRFIIGWLPDAPRPDITYGPTTWLREVADSGGMDWHLRTSDYLTIRQGNVRIGDVVWRRNEGGIPMLGIARDRVMGHFLADNMFPGGSTVAVMPFEREPVWVGRIN